MLISDNFQYQIYIAAFDISFNVSLQAQPIVFPADQLFSFFDSKIIYKKVIMMLVDKLEVDNF